MKKIVQKQEEIYYCDYCGEKCRNTPRYMMPVKKRVTYDGTRDNNIEPEQKDVCPECQKKIAKLLTMIDRFTFKDMGMTTQIIYK